MGPWVLINARWYNSLADALHFFQQVEIHRLIPDEPGIFLVDK